MDDAAAMLGGLTDAPSAAELGAAAAAASAQLAARAEGSGALDDLPSSAQRKLPRRFYDSVSVRACDAYGRPVVDGDGGAGAQFWEVLLDNRPAKTVGHAQLLAPSRELAVAIAAEFAMHRDLVHPGAAPLYKLLGTAIDLYPEETERLRSRLAEYLETDNVCFRVGDETGDPRDNLCHARQEKHYRPLIDWFESHFGGPLDVVSGIQMPRHPPGIAEKVLESVEDADHYWRAAVGALLDATKSTVISLAFAHRFIGIDQAFDAARVEEEHQIELGGFVYDGHDTARIGLKVQLAAVSTFLRLVPGAGPKLPKKIA